LTQDFSNTPLPKLQKEIQSQQTTVKKQSNILQTPKSTTSKFEEVMIPISIDYYRQNMRGVDRFDQKASYYSIQLKSKRWYIKMFFILLRSPLSTRISFIKMYMKQLKKFLSVTLNLGKPLQGIW